MSVPKNRPPAQGHAGSVPCQGLLLGQAGRFLWTLLGGLGRWLLPSPTPHPGYRYFILEPNKNGKKLQVGGCLSTPGQLLTTFFLVHSGSGLTLVAQISAEAASLGSGLLSESSQSSYTQRVPLSPRIHPTRALQPSCSLLLPETQAEGQKWD